jgi:hypothetical protein
MSTDDTEPTANTMYPKVNPAKLEPHYSRHVLAMTAERLNSKADIAAQLAKRDSELEQLQVRNVKLLYALKQCGRYVNHKSEPGEKVAAFLGINAIISAAIERTEQK